MSSYQKETTQLRKLAAELLTSGQVEQVIGYTTADFVTRTRPVIIRDPQMVDQLILNSFCCYNLSSYLARYPRAKTAVVLKGCDLKTVNLLLLEKQLKRENVVTILCYDDGILDLGACAQVGRDRELELAACQRDGELLKLTFADGKLDLAWADALAAKCVNCSCQANLKADYTIGEPATKPSDPDAEYRFVLEFEQMSADARQAFWERHFSRCVRCYACRNVCPICYCSKCVFEQTAPEVVSTFVDTPDNMFYQMIRVQHGIGRCTDCGECERACPQQLPLRLLTKALERQIKQDLGYKPGQDDSTLPPLATFDPEDDNGPFG